MNASVEAEKQTWRSVLRSRIDSMLARNTQWASKHRNDASGRLRGAEHGPVHQWFRGSHRSWSEALAASDGYDNPIVLEQVRAASQVSRDRSDVHERDGVLLSDPQPNFPLVASLLRVAAANAGRLHVLDVGGSLGSSYRQVCSFLAELPQLTWSVVEQPHFVACGRSEFTTAVLRFYERVSDVSGAPHVALLSGVLPYVAAPYAMLEEVARSGVRWLVVDRTPVIDADDDIITVQHVPASLYGTPVSYPARLFSRRKLLEAVSRTWPTCFETHALDGRWNDGGRWVDFRFVLAGPAR